MVGLGRKKVSGLVYKRRYISEGNGVTIKGREKINEKDKINKQTNKMNRILLEGKDEIHSYQDHF